MLSTFDLQCNLYKGFVIYEKYKWLINSYVLDFFTENHWSTLPDSWKNMEEISINEVAELLDHEKQSQTYVFPLSILALKQLFRDMNITRKQISEQLCQNNNIITDEKLMKTFWRSVKVKKRHEIPIMTELCHELATKTSCHYIVDVGSGLGHLSRMLNYGHNFEVCAVEAQQQLVDQARVLDSQFENIFHRKYGKRKTINHVNIRIENDITTEAFLKIVRSTFNIPEADFKFGIVGLHPCGDLGPTLLRLYRESPYIKFINVVGCCFMKLTSVESSLNPGFPLSQYCLKNNHGLCYHSKEIACHAIENYISKLYDGEHWKLRIHAYRATIEKVLVGIDPQYKHIPLANVKYTEGLDFESYCKKATSKLHETIDPDYINSEAVQRCLKQSKFVVLFYSFRLFFAPLIESLILYDRALFLLEKGCEVDLIPGFETRISPRMHVLQSWKL